MAFILLQTRLALFHFIAMEFRTENEFIVFIYEYGAHVRLEHTHKKSVAEISKHIRALGMRQLRQLLFFAIQNRSPKIAIRPLCFRAFLSLAFRFHYILTALSFDADSSLLLRSYLIC